MKNKIRFEDLTHFIFLFLLFLSFTTIFLSMKNDDSENEEIESTTITSIETATDFDLEINNGKKLFRANCGSCHSSDMVNDMTAPALGGVQERWERREENLRAWIRNSGKYLVENPNDEYAQNLYKKWGVSMTANPHLTDEEIESILSYIEVVYNQ